MKKRERIMVLGLLISAMFLLPISAVENETTSVKNSSYTHKSKAIDCSMQSDVEWAKTYGRDEFDMLYNVEETDDGGYIAAGATEEADIYYVWLLKLDSEGNEEWAERTNRINGEEALNVHAIDILKTSDGGYLITALGEVYLDDFDSYEPVGYLWKVSGTGDSEWWRNYYSQNPLYGLYFWMIFEVTDGYIAGGYKAYDYGVSDALLIKFSLNGDIEWQREYDYGTKSDEMHSLVCTDDGGYLLTGYTDSVGSGELWMLKTDAEGNKEWEKTYGGSKLEWSLVRGCCQTGDSGYIMCGNTYSFGAGDVDLWIVKTDALGNIEWNRTYGGQKRDICWSMDTMNNGDYIFCVTKNFEGFTETKDDIWIIMTDEDGNTQYSQIFDGLGGTETEIGSYIGKTSDGGCIVAGRTGRWGSASSDGLLVKLVPIENQRPNKPEKPTGPASGTPGTEYTFTTSVTDVNDDQIYLMWDWGDGNFSEWLGLYNANEICEATYVWANEGSYSIKVMAKDEHGGESDWSDPLPVNMPKTCEGQLWTFIVKLFNFLEQLLGRHILPYSMF